MAYDTSELESQALEAIKQHNLTKFCQIALFVPGCNATLYNHELEKLDTIKNALESNRISKKKKMTDKWENSDNPTLQIAAFKLMADEDELTRLNSQKTEVEHSFTDKPLKIGYGDRDAE